MGCSSRKMQIIGKPASLFSVGRRVHSICTLMLFLPSRFIDASKLRSWLDSSQTLFEGSLSSPRAYHGFSSNDGMMYVFGGLGPNGKAMNDIFVLDPIAMTGTDLTEATTGTPPSERYQHCFASAVGRLYVYGGRDQNYQLLNDLYSFDPVSLSWTNISTPAAGTPPPARSGSGFISTGGILYVHGGSDAIEAIFSSDLHSFDPRGHVWTNLSEQVTGTPPKARYGHGFTSAGELLYVYGGVGFKNSNDAVFLDDLYSFDPSTKVWTDLSSAAAGIPPIARGWLGFTSAGGKLYVHGGWNNDKGNKFLTDLHSFDPVGKIWKDLSATVQGIPPKGRGSNGFMSVGGKVCVHCGRDDESRLLIDLFCFDPVAQSWYELSGATTGSQPDFRYGHGFTSAGGKLYFHGGKNLVPALNDLRSFDPVTQAWTDLSATTTHLNITGSPPTARAWHGFTSAEGKLYVHAGKTDETIFSDLHSFDPVTNSWTDLSTASSPPIARFYHGFTSAGGLLYVHGGQDDTRIFSDLYSFDPVAHVWTNHSSAATGALPTARCGHGFTSAGGLLYVHGGCAHGVCKSDLYSFDPSTKVWTDLSSAVSGFPPIARGWHGFTSAGGKLYVHGGWDLPQNYIYGDLHSFDPIVQVWTNLSLSVAGDPPTARNSHGFATVGSRLYVQGGTGFADFFSQVDMLAVTYPQAVEWKPSSTGWEWLVWVYDWDTIVLKSDTAAIVSYSLNLCSGFFPCAMHLRGKGIIQLSGGAQFSCFSSAGCISISIHEVAFSCRNVRKSVFLIEGSVFGMSNVSFMDCSADTDGGVVHAYEMADVVLEACNFTRVYSDGLGGVVAAYGSSLTVSNSLFHNCSSRNGGGALWASAYPDCFSTNQSRNTNLRIFSSVFNLCSTGCAGGAVLADSQSLSATGSALDVVLSSSLFYLCMSSAEGGALSISGAQISALVSKTVFDSCSSKSVGGAVSASDFSSLSLLDCALDRNTAWGTGGGAIHLKRCNFAVHNISLNNNQAPMGGGGILLWRNWVRSAAFIDCPSGFGRVVASCESVLTDLNFCRFGTCSQCIPGKYREAGDEAIDCSPCHPGTFADLEGASVCSSCSVGTYSEVPGAYNSAVCFSCAVGTYSSIHGTSFCFLCSAGTFSDTQGSTVCSICSAGTYSSFEGAISSSVCLLCNPGTFSDGSGSFCRNCPQSCPSGQYFARDKSILLPDGQECSPALGAAADTPIIKSCQTGTISRFNYGDNENLSALVWVAAPLSLIFTQFDTEAGYDYITVLSCTTVDCLNSTVLLDRYSGSIIPCPVTSSTGIILIQWHSDDNVVGQGWSATWTFASEVCMSCPPGTYSPVDNENSLSICPFCAPGTFSDESGSSICTTCGMGRYSSVAGSNSSAACLRCPEGTYSSVSGASSSSVCIPCDASTAQDSTICGDCPHAAEDSSDISLPCNSSSASRSSLVAQRIGEHNIRSFRYRLDDHVENIPQPHEYEWAYNRHLIRFPSFSEQEKIVDMQAGTGSLDKLNTLGKFVSILKLLTKVSSSEDAVHSILEGKAEHLSVMGMQTQQYKKNSKFAARSETSQQRSYQEELLRSAAAIGASEPVQKLKVQRRQQLIADDSSDLSVASRAVSIDNILCRPKNNSALFGPCIATDFWALLVEGALTRDQPAYPGISFPVVVLKKDAYNQTILSDSSSILQIRTSLNGTVQINSAVSILGSPFAQLDQGVATFDVQLKPSYSRVISKSGITSLQTNPFIYFEGQDTQGQSTFEQTMKSPVYPIALSDGFRVCPLGFVLVFDNPSVDILKGPALCHLCPAGTYSVSPLAPPVAPACLNCPAGGNCLLGGNKITFAIGEWGPEIEEYRLKTCPAGTQLINSTRGDSHGIFSHDNQQCKPCLPSEYIINPNTDTCQTCPPGLECNSTDAVVPKRPNSAWVRNGPFYRLTGCPSGHRVSSMGQLGRFDATVQECVPCPKGEECVSLQCVICSPCAPNSYKPTATDDPCTHCPANSYNTLDGAQDQSTCLPCPAGAICSDDDFCSLRHLPLPSCPGGSRIVGSWQYDNVSSQYSVIDCPEGYVRNSAQCKLCPASFYCSGGLSTPCAPYHFSLPGSSHESSCIESVFTFVVINVPISRPFFEQTAKQTVMFQTALANFSHLEPAHVMVQIVQAGSDASTTDVTSSIATSDALSAHILANNLWSLDAAGGIKQGFIAMGSQFSGASLSSVKVTACVPGYALQSLPPSTCLICKPNFFCLGNSEVSTPCPGGSFSDAGANSSVSCKPYAVQFLIRLPISLPNFTDVVQSTFIKAVASTTGVSPGRISISSTHTIADSRAVPSSMEVNAQISTDNIHEAAALGSSVDVESLNRNLIDNGLPPSRLMSVSVQSPASPAGGSQFISDSALAGIAVGGFVLILLAVVAVYHLFATIMRYKAHKTFVAAIMHATAGGEASSHMLPLGLRNQYKANRVLGKGSFGCVILANKKGSDQNVAIKVMVPETGIFDETRIRRLRREAATHELFMLKKCDHAVHLAANMGTNAVNIRPDICWFVLEFLDGGDMCNVVYGECKPPGQEGEPADERSQPIKYRACIQVSRAVLAALKVMHAEGVIHRDIKPDNIVRCLQPDGKPDIYKLIDFGSAIGVDESVAKEAMMTLVGNRALAAGTPPYMSPEMFKEPENASYPTDIWSLGVTMFELVTARLPFKSDSDLLWSFAVAGNMDEKAPEVFDVLSEDRRSTFDSHLSRVVGKALEKQVRKRYQSVDQMHQSVYACLVEQGEACYSAFISYRVASESPLARLLFDELNHSITPGGHRVTVYLDTYRLVKGEDWESGFASGLLRSLCFLPLLSYGFTAPLAFIPEERILDAVAKGWEEKPLGRMRLAGVEWDTEDNCLKELLIAQALLGHKPTVGGDRLREANQLRIAYPILFGRQEPQGHAQYPRMGSFFSVQGGGGRFVDKPSPPTARAAGCILRDKAGFTSEAVNHVQLMSVSETMSAMTRLQGCQLWNHPKELEDTALTKEQSDLIDKGCVGPAVALDDIPLTEAQKKAMIKSGMDERQLRMLKAEVRLAIPGIHAVIDRAVADVSRQQELTRITQEQKEILMAHHEGHKGSVGLASDIVSLSSI